MEEYLGNEYILSNISMDENANLIVISVILIMEITFFICLFRGMCKNNNGINDIKYN